LNQGDYNRNGTVDLADYSLWRRNLGMTPATFENGDGNGNGVVDNEDYSLWAAHYGQVGNADYAADFNRDGIVDQDDHDIWARFQGMQHCASRFEGDADGDGDVDEADEVIWNGGQPLFSAQVAASGLQGSLNLLPNNIPKSADVNGDGSVDESDLAALDQIILGGGTSEEAASADQSNSFAPEPTLAEP
jgi:hypothetical protein